jgi:membrane protease YdiL (CAAX protease family)
LLGPVIYLAPVGLDLALGGQRPPWPRGAPTLGLVMASFGWVLFFDGGMEEPGWRGFALPRPQERWSPLPASVILGVFWSLWHAPLYFFGRYTAASSTGPAGVAGVLSRFGWVIPLAIIFAWLYNRSGRSALVTMILPHASFNTTTAIIALSDRAAVLFLATTWGIALIGILMDRMWRRQSGGRIAGLGTRAAALRAA